MAYDQTLSGNANQGVRKSKGSGKPRHTKEVIPHFTDKTMSVPSNMTYYRSDERPKTNDETSELTHPTLFVEGAAQPLQKTNGNMRQHRAFSHKETSHNQNSFNPVVNSGNETNKCGRNFEKQANQNQVTVNRPFKPFQELF
ncbi:MAG TPA: hypothetical protein DCY20_01930 [Firmicutes bacterium]|nr:hypothetical protein [Bacillota bacterium]